MKAISKILGAAAMMCYILILAILFVAAPMAAGYKTVVVLTGSMEPAFPAGSVIYYKAASFENINPNDVISFGISDDAHTVVTHRVVSKDQMLKTLTTKGDANNSSDPKDIAFSNVKGKVISYHLPYVGTYIRYIQNYYIIGAIFLILIGKLIADRLNGRHIIPGKEPEKTLTQL